MREGDFNHQILDCINDALSTFGSNFTRVVYSNWNSDCRLSEIDIPSHTTEFSSLLKKTFGAAGGQTIEVVIVRTVKSFFQLNEDQHMDLSFVVDAARRRYEPPKMVCAACEAGNHRECKKLWEIIVKSPSSETDLRPGERFVQCCDRREEWAKTSDNLSI
jgi:hypothetical protein